MEQVLRQHSAEVAHGERFEFGANWARFLSSIDEQRIERAEQSLASMLKLERLDGKRFLDIGSGSGLFSLAARKLGADVLSFDYDPKSVACTMALKERYFPKDSQWHVEEGSVLDIEYLSDLGRFDVVYSWGVLHHTGDQWQALGNLVSLVERGGFLFVALYNDQGPASSVWKRVKEAYNKLGKLGFLILWPAFLRLWAPTFLRDLLSGRPFRSWRNYSSMRGMSPWRDVVDWVGGYPFEVSKPEEVFRFCSARGFELINLTTCAGGLGCNEYVFKKK